ncbi:NHL repeat-containing protein [Cellulomonas sp. DKR-3]|uniref:NHL repeat-containing protein n=1 Tax=Cellulomonas fulva TaxID=2835530 RepID=A0ABS5TXW9_9CELL|nr:Ig-like domain repeat protein [Cellulomonas fulva]MBT0994001.1 NHL repeat-containing protein [Cellulomonas fulva]
MVQFGRRARGGALVVALALAVVPVAAPRSDAATVGFLRYEGAESFHRAGTLMGAAVAGGERWVVSTPTDTEEYPVGLRYGGYGSAWGTVDGLSITPWDVDLTPTDAIVSDYINSRVVVASREVAHGRPLTTNTLAKPGGFGRPSAVAVASDGRVYVADVVRHSVSVFAADLTFLTEWSDEHQLAFPTGMDAAPDGTVYVTDGSLGVVRRFTAGGRLLATFGSTGTSEQRLRSAQDVAVDADGRAYVVDPERHRVAIYSADGRFQTAFGQADPALPDYLLRPAAVTTDEAGRVYVADAGRGLLLRFQPLVRAWSRPQVSGAPVVGGSLTASPGGWAVTDPYVTYQWLRAGQPVAGATRASYRVGTADVGRTLAVRVTAQRAGTGSGTSVSAAVTVPRLRSSTAVVASASSVPRDGSVVLLVAVSGSSGVVPTGKVTVKDGTTTVRTLSLTAGAHGVVRTSVRLTTRGTHRLTAVYVPSSVYAGSSAAVPVVVR